jgi:two-component system CheB/CheR fusion protein
VKLRQISHRQIPIIILTGDISTDALRRVSLEQCVQLHKPIKGGELLQVIQRLLAMPPVVTAPTASRPGGVDAAGAPIVFVVEDDSHIREGIRGVLEAGGLAVEDYADCETFLEAYRPGRESCLLLDAHLPGMTGFDLLKRMTDAGQLPPTIMITGNSDVRMVVQAIKAGASDFIEKPVGRGELLASVGRALDEARDASVAVAWREAAVSSLSGLTARQRQVMEMVLDGQPSKNIAAELGISQRTVENHRAEIMRKTGAKSLPALARLVLAAARKGSGEPAP